VKGNDPRSFLFTINTTQSGSAGIISTGNTAVNEGFTVGIGFGNLAFVKAGLVSGVVGVGGYSADYNPTVNRVNDGKWHTVLVTWNGKTLKTYIDNVLTLLVHDYSFNAIPPQSFTTMKFNTTGDLNYLGRYNVPEQEYYFDGSLKDISIYDEEIFINYILDASGPKYVEADTHKPMYGIAIGAIFMAALIAVYSWLHYRSDNRGEYSVLVDKV
jgi:hypothetical protein